MNVEEIEKSFIGTTFLNVKIQPTVLKLKLSLFEKANLFKRFWFLIFESILRVFQARKNFAVRRRKLKENILCQIFV